VQNSRIAICSYHSTPVWPGGPPVPELDDMQGISRGSTSNDSWASRASCSKTGCIVPIIAPMLIDRQVLDGLVAMLQGGNNSAQWA
jgi:hypothetical protein